MSRQPVQCTLLAMGRWKDCHSKQWVPSCLVLSSEDLQERLSPLPQTCWCTMIHIPVWRLLTLRKKEVVKINICRSLVVMCPDIFAGNREEHLQQSSPLKGKSESYSATVVEEGAFANCPQTTPEWGAGKGAIDPVFTEAHQCNHNTCSHFGLAKVQFGRCWS